MDMLKTKMLRNPEQISYTDLRTKIEAIRDIPTKQLACLAYATGARVSELNQIHTDDIFFWKNESHLAIRCKVLKKHKEGITRLAFVHKDEQWLIKPILERKEYIINGIMFKYSRSQIYRILRKTTGFNPHAFRKLRATHLVVERKFNVYQLLKFFDWARLDTTAEYVKLNLDEIAYDYTEVDKNVQNVERKS